MFTTNNLPARNVEDMLVALEAVPNDLHNLNIFNGRVAYDLLPGLAAVQSTLSGASGVFVSGDLVGAVDGWYQTGAEIVVLVHEMTATVWPVVGETLIGDAVENLREIVYGTTMTYRPEGNRAPVVTPIDEIARAAPTRFYGVPTAGTGDPAAATGYVSLDPLRRSEDFSGLVLPIALRDDDWTIQCGAVSRADAGRVRIGFQITALKDRDWDRVKEALGNLAPAYLTMRRVGVAGVQAIDQLRALRGGV